MISPWRQCRKNAEVIEYAPDAIKNDRDFMLTVVRKNPGVFRYALDVPRNDRETVMTAVQQDGSLLYYASKELKNDRDIVLAAVQKDGGALSYASKDLKGDRDIVFAAVQRDGRALGYASKEMRKDREIVMAAMQQNGQAFEFVSEELNGDRELVLMAIRQDGRMIKYASEEMRKDPELAMIAVRQNTGAYFKISEELKSNHDIALAFVEKDGCKLGFLPKELQNDPEIVLVAVQQNPIALQFASDELKNNPDIVLAAIEQNPMALQYASEELKNNRDIVIAAVQKNGRTLDYASEELKNDFLFSHLAEEQKQKPSPKETQSLNFLWLGLDLPAKPDPEDGSIRLPLPEEYIGNVREAGKRHPRADINLWFDSRRLTQKQWDYLEAVVEDEMPNVHVRDLCSIPEYANEELYSRPETRKDWRSGGYVGVVWLQVDAAKILIHLQGDYDQHFFADLDHAHIDIESDKVQKMLSKHGMLIGASSEYSSCLENQLWGFVRSRKKFFKIIMMKAWKCRIGDRSPMRLCTQGLTANLMSLNIWRPRKSASRSAVSALHMQNNQTRNGRLRIKAALSLPAANSPLFSAREARSCRRPMIRPRSWRLLLEADAHPLRACRLDL